MRTEGHEGLLRVGDVRVISHGEYEGSGMERVFLVGIKEEKKGCVKLKLGARLKFKER